MLGMAQAAAQAQVRQPGQVTAASPPAGEGPSMAYDAATRKVVLFDAGQTWTWGGSAWTERTPTTSPPDLFNASMAYDAATRTVVLFGGSEPHHSGALNQTWTWNGSAWTKQTPATSPPARGLASMAYDAATRTVVLFGGQGNGARNDTWTWNGANWTKQTPATRPTKRLGASMAYDAATRKVVLFAGRTFRNAILLNDTWTWNGRNWARQTPATSPGARQLASMAYDAATQQVVLFGGFDNESPLGDTWTWNGRNWARQTPATSPPGRDGAPMAHDAANQQVVLFGGVGNDVRLNDTWTWNGATWAKRSP